jgi:hypothetical protein
LWLFSTTEPLQAVQLTPEGPRFVAEPVILAHYGRGRSAVGLSKEHHRDLLNTGASRATNRPVVLPHR